MIKVFGYILILVLLACFGWFAWVFYGYFVSSDDNIKASLIGLFGIVCVALLTQYYAQKREIAARHFVEKTKAYSHVFDLVFKILTNTKEGKSIKETELFKDGMELKKALMVWGSQDVLKAWNKYEVDAAADNAPDKILLNVDAIFRRIREDLGHNDSSMAEGELFKTLIIATEKEKFLKTDTSGEQHA